MNTISRALRRGLWPSLFVCLLLLAMHTAGLFRDSQLTLSNSYFVPRETSGEIVIVALDNASLEAFGRSPADWSRTVYADLVDELVAAEARVIAFDLLFSEPSNEDDVFAESLLRARTGDTRTRLVLAGAGVQIPGNVPEEAPFERALYYTEALEPLPVLAEVADYIGYVNVFPDADGTIRRQPSLLYLDDELQFSFNLATYLAYLRIPGSSAEMVISAENGELKAAERFLPVDENGFWRQHFSGPPTTTRDQTFDVVSLVDIVNGNVDPGLFADRIVLIGLFDSSGATDIYPVPSSGRGNPMPGVEIQANALETLLQGRPLREQSRVSEMIMIALVSFFAGIIYALPRWYIKLVLALVFCAFGLLVAFTLFNVQLLIINLFYLLLSIILPVLIAIGVDITYEIQQRQRVSFLLETLKNVSEGQLSRERVIEDIKHDVARLVPGTQSRVYLLDTSNKNLVGLDDGKKPSTETIPDRALANMMMKPQVYKEDNQVMLPVLWQGELLAMLRLENPSASVFNRHRIELLQEMTEHLAPVLANMRLYQVSQQQRDMLQTVLERSPSGVAVLSADLQIVESNAALEQFFQPIVNTAIEGKPLRALFEAVEISEIQSQALLKQLHGQKPFRERVEVVERSFDIAGAPLGDGQWVTVIHDVSDLVALNKLRAQMMRMASHDLKNPLGRILGYAELVSMDVEDEDVLQFVNNIIRSGEEMNTLIEEILDLERTRSGKMDITDVDFREIVQQVIWRHEPDTVRKKQTYVSDVPEDEIILSGDFRQLSQVVSNLIGNAIKYTPDEGTVTVRLLPHPDKVRFEVRDTGIGIPEDAQAQLFTEFYRVKSVATRDIKGTGLGLSLVKSVVDAHHGVVGVESEEGKGSLFFVELPRKMEFAE